MYKLIYKIRNFLRPTTANISPSVVSQVQQVLPVVRPINFPTHSSRPNRFPYPRFIKHNSRSITPYLQLHFLISCHNILPVDPSGFFIVDFDKFLHLRTRTIHLKTHNRILFVYLKFSNWFPKSPENYKYHSFWINKI